MASFVFLFSNLHDRAKIIKYTTDLIQYNELDYPDKKGRFECGLEPWRSVLHQHWLTEIYLRYGSEWGDQKTSTISLFQRHSFILHLSSFLASFFVIIAGNSQFFPSNKGERELFSKLTRSWFLLSIYASCIWWPYFFTFYSRKKCLWE